MNAPAEVRQCGLRHGYAYHGRIKAESVDHHSRIRLVEHRSRVIGGSERMKMHSLFLSTVPRPHKRGIGTPDLNSSWVLRLPNVDCATRGLRRVMRQIKRGANGLSWVSNTAFVISEVPSASGTKMTLMWMNTKPIFDPNEERHSMCTQSV